MRANCPRDRPIHRKDRTVYNDSVRSVCKCSCSPFCEFSTFSLCICRRRMLNLCLSCSNICNICCCHSSNKLSFATLSCFHLRIVQHSSEHSNLRHVCLVHGTSLGRDCPLLCHRSGCWPCTGHPVSSLLSVYTFCRRQMYSCNFWIRSDCENRNQCSLSSPCRACIFWWPHTHDHTCH